MIGEIIKSVLTALYQPFWYAVILSMLILYVWKINPSIKGIFSQWIGWFKADKEFRRLFLLVFYSVMIVFRTLMNRNMWVNPVSNVIGVWGLHRINSAGEVVFTTEVIENLALFIPFTILLLWTYSDKLLKKPTLPHILWQSTKIVFLFSFTIEFLQLFLRLGTWQLSDLFFNTLGGFIGGLIYWIGWKLRDGARG